MVGWKTCVVDGKGRTALASVCVSGPTAPPSCFKTTAQKDEFQLLINQKHSKFPKVPAPGVIAIVPEPSRPIKKPARGRHRSHASPFPGLEAVLVPWGGCTVTRAVLCHPSNSLQGLASVNKVENVPHLAARPLQDRQSTARTRRYAV